jgi:hypothetical protein
MPPDACRAGPRHWARCAPERALGTSGSLRARPLRLPAPMERGACAHGECATRHAARDSRGRGHFPDGVGRAFSIDCVFRRTEPPMACAPTRLRSSLSVGAAENWETGEKPVLPPQRCWSVGRGSDANGTIVPERWPHRSERPLQSPETSPGDGSLDRGGRSERLRCPPCRGCADLLILSAISGLSAQRAAEAAGPTHAKGLQDR